VTLRSPSPTPFGPTHIRNENLSTTTKNLEAVARITRTTGSPLAHRAAITALLNSGNAHGTLAIAVAQPELRSAALDAVRVLVEREIDAGAAWPAQAAHWLSLAGADWQTSAAMCNNWAWYAHIRRQSALLHLRGADHLLHPGTDRVHARALGHLHLVSLRYAFRCHSIARLADALTEVRRQALDPYTQALLVFAALGQSRAQGLTAMEDLLDAAGANLQVRHALLHGLWLGAELPAQAERLLHLTQHPFFDDDDPVMLFRRAGALRQLDRRADALQAIDDAIEALGPDQVEALSDFVRERALITSQRPTAR